jgi:hypothetical protein
LKFPHSARFDYLSELPLSPESLAAVQEMKKKSEALNPAHQIAHLPYFIILAQKNL